MWPCRSQPAELQTKRAGAAAARASGLVHWHALARGLPARRLQHAAARSSCQAGKTRPAHTSEELPWQPCIGPPLSRWMPAAAAACASLQSTVTACQRPVFDHERCMRDNIHLKSMTHVSPVVLLVLAAFASASAPGVAVMLAAIDQRVAAMLSLGTLSAGMHWPHSASQRAVRCWRG